MVGRARILIIELELEESSLVPRPRGLGTRLEESSARNSAQLEPGHEATRAMTRGTLPGYVPSTAVTAINTLFFDSVGMQFSGSPNQVKR